MSPRDPEKERERARQYYAANREQVREKTRQRRAENPEKNREIQRRSYKKNREKRLEDVRRRYIENREAINAAARRRYTSEPQKVRARSAVARALACGEIAREPCLFCDSPKTEGHHHDYALPLAVTWLCSFHHGLVHRI